MTLLGISTQKYIMSWRAIKRKTRIRLQGGFRGLHQIFIKDVESLNGTCINGDRLNLEGLESSSQMA